MDPQARDPDTNLGFTRADNVQPMDEILRLNAEARFENSREF